MYRLRHINRYCLVGMVILATSLLAEIAPEFSELIQVGIFCMVAQLDVNFTCTV